MKKYKSKLSFKHWDTKVSSEMERSDISAEEFAIMILEVIRASGFNEDKVVDSVCGLSTPAGYAEES